MKTEILTQTYPGMRWRKDNYERGSKMLNGARMSTGNHCEKTEHTIRLANEHNELYKQKSALESKMKKISQNMVELAPLLTY